MRIWDLVTAPEIAAYWTEAQTAADAMAGDELFPSRKKAGLELSWIKGAGGLSAVLKPSAFDADITYRDRIGISQTETLLPFFREGMKINEKERQELLKLQDNPQLASLANLIVGKVFDDISGLVAGAKAALERMRMQLISTGLIAVENNGIKVDYNFGVVSAQKETLTGTDVWSDATNSMPVDDILGWQDSVESTKGFRPTRAICSLATFRDLQNNAGIKAALVNLKVMPTRSAVIDYLISMTGVAILVYNKKYTDYDGTTGQYFPDSVFTLLPDTNVGHTWYGTTPEEADLMMDAKSEANVAIVDTGVAITTYTTKQPVNVETKVSQIVLPSAENIDRIFIATIS